MRASRQFKEAPKPKTPKKSRIVNGRCVQTDKIPMGRTQAIGLSSSLGPDDRGLWSAYKCPYGKSHWHVGHVSPAAHKGMEE